MKDLETQYSILFGKFVEGLTKQYMVLVREALAEERENIRMNALNMQTFADKLREIREKVAKKPAFKNIFKAMRSVFEAIDGRIVKDIKKAYGRRKFPIPKTVAQEPSNLEQAISENVDLIKGIVDKQTKLLETAVVTAIRKGADYKTVHEAVMAQSDKGKNYAKFVAADQVAKAYGAINAERQASSGIPGYIWSSMNDSKTRHSHRLPDGKFFLWNKTMPNDLRPRDASGKILNPGEDYRCRCGAIPAFDQSDADLFKQNTFDAAEPKV